METGKNGAPEEIRTPSLLIRSQMLYPVELRAHGRIASHEAPGKKARTLMKLSPALQAAEGLRERPIKECTI